MNNGNNGGNGGNVIREFGVNVWWTCPGLVRDGIEAQGALQRHGFETTDIKLPTRRTEVSRAVYSFQNRQGKDDRRVAEKAADDKDHITYSILDREQSGEEVKFMPRTVIRMEKATGAVSAEGKLQKEVLEAIQSYEGKITDEDVRGFLSKLIKRCFGIPKRPTGGIYFIPARFASLVKSAQAVLDELKSGAKLYVEGVVNGEQERANVWESVEDEIESRLQETMAAVGRIERSVNAVKDHEAQIEWVKELMEVYKGLLGEEAKYQTMAEKIEDAVKVVSNKMAELQAGTGAVLSKATNNAAGKLAGAAMPPDKEVSVSKDNKWVVAAVGILKSAGKPLHYKEITAKAIAAGLTTEGKTPENTMAARLGAAAKTAGAGIVAQGRGLYAAA